MFYVFLIFIGKKYIMADYKIKVLQIQEVPGYPDIDVPEYLVEHSNNVGADCKFEFIGELVKKSNRNMPTPGIIWHNCIVRIPNSNCPTPYVQMVNRNGIVKIKLKKQN